MPYESAHYRFTRALYRAHSCPWLFQDSRCGGGDYCPFPPGESRTCCFFCPFFDSCPDRSGVCMRFLK